MDGEGAFTLYGEIDLISCHDFNIAEPIKSDTIDHTENFHGNNIGKNKKFISFMNKNMTESTEIIAYSPVYVLNENGRTVETI